MALREWPALWRRVITCGVLEWHRWKWKISRYFRTSPVWRRWQTATPPLNCWSSHSATSTYRRSAATTQLTREPNAHLFTKDVRTPRTFLTPGHFPVRTFPSSSFCVKFIRHRGRQSTNKNKQERDRTERITIQEEEEEEERRRRRRKKRKRRRRRIYLSQIHIYIKLQTNTC